MLNIISKLKDNFSGERLSVGLDIGNSTVKIVKLKFIKDEVTLCGFDIESSTLELNEVLKKIKQAHGAELVNISVSGAQTVIRYANFPKMNASELRQALKFEAQKHIPFSVSEVNLDGYILEDDLPDNKMLVLIAAVKKELVSSRLKLLESVNLAANSVDMDSIALVNAFNFNNPSVSNGEHKAAALLNIGATVSNLDILEAGMPRLSRDMHIAGNTFTHKIMDVFGIDFNNADKLKFDPESDPEKKNKINAAVESVLSNLATEIRTSFDYYESQNASSVAKIFLSGGASKFNGLKDMLSRLLGLEVENWDPLKQLQINQAIGAEKIKAASGQLAVAVGLALRA
ncbi:MAG: type IV pilus assembly protein PilM [Candidatus Omnitrophota bacterium]|nr:type IV pilus assembly protein PilM [Candidatus Omnitrophota bacterium]